MIQKFNVNFTLKYIMEMFLSKNIKQYSTFPVFKTKRTMNRIITIVYFKLLSIIISCRDEEIQALQSCGFIVIIWK